MLEKLKWEEIQQRYPDEWVALIDYEWPNMGNVTAGIVHAHSRRRDELLQLQKGLPSAAILWTGKKHALSLLAAVDVD